MAAVVEVNINQVMPAETEAQAVVVVAGRVAQQAQDQLLKVTQVA
jgi:predicted fused transcriptional regulator/phosphomethylpyrimidine kinase